MLLPDPIELRKDMFSTFLCLKRICQLIDFIKDFFYMLVGIDLMTIEGSRRTYCPRSSEMAPSRRGSYRSR